jgi:hypothetical protein
MNKNESTPEFIKRFFEKAYKKCRTCNHLKITHDNASGVCLDNVLKVEREMLSRCKCEEFIPLDNVDYLEWEYDQKSKKKRK